MDKNVTVGAGAVGKSLLRLEDGPLLRGTAQFIDDLKPEGHLHVAFLRSPLASARIESIDVAAARKAPGVVAVFTGSDLHGACAPMRVHLTTPGAVAPDRPIIADHRVRFVGEIVAAAVAGSRYEAEDALELIQANLDPLPPVVTFEDAMAAGAPLVHESVPKNQYFLGHRTMGNVEKAFAEADVVVEGEVVHPRVSAAPMEGRGVIAAPDGAGGVVAWSSTQAPHLVAEAIAESLDIDEEKVRVIASDVGGGFGLKAHVQVEEILLSWIALQLKRTVKWIEDRSEHLQAANHARDQKVSFSAAVRNDGRVLGLRATVLSSIGAYGIRPHGPLLDPMTCAGLIPGPYDIRDYEYDSYALATNKCPEGPYRGVGMVTAVLVHERLMDLIASRLNIDPADVRRLNFVKPEQMPYTAATGHPYESGDYPAALEAALSAFDYTRARAEQSKARASGRLVGIGLGSYVEFTGAGSSTFKARGMIGIPGTDTARVWVDDEGRVRVQTSCPAIGQGVQTTIAQVAAAQMGIDPESVSVEQTDTGKVGRGTGSFMSRSSVTAATSTYRAATQLRDEILNAASWRLDQPVDRLSIGSAAILVDGQPTGITLGQLAAADPSENGGHLLDVSVTYDPVQAAHPYATHACLVEVDAGSGAVEIHRYVIAEDCGTMINPMIVDGQVAGGVAQGIGAALLEEITYGDDGQLLSGSFMDYLLPTAGEVPAVEIKHLVTPSTVHELGTKGIGEGGTIGATAAVANAVADALSVTDGTLPFTPDRVLAILLRGESPFRAGGLAERDPAAPPLPGQIRLKRLTAAGIVVLALNLRIAVGEIPPVLRDLHLGEFERSLLVTIPVICFSLAAFAGPPLSARLGEERGLLVMCAALCAGLALRPWWPSFSLFAGTIVCGLAVAVMNVMMPSVLRRRFPERVGEMTAAYTMALSIGAGLAVGLTVPLVHAFGGSVAAALAIWAVPAAVAVGLWLPQIRRPLPSGRSAGAGVGLLKDWQAWQITAFFGIQSALYYTLLSWLPTIYRDRGTSPTAAGAVLAVMSVVGIAGNFAAPLLAVRFGRPRLAVLLAGGVTMVGLIGVLVAPSQLALLWATLLGIGTGGTFSVTLLLMASRARDAVIAARLSGMAQGIGYMISAVGPLLAGLLHSATGGWQVPLIATIVICGAQLAAGLGAARPGVVAR